MNLNLHYDALEQCRREARNQAKNFGEGFSAKTTATGLLGGVGGTLLAKIAAVETLVEDEFRAARTLFDGVETGLDSVDRIVRKAHGALYQPKPEMTV
ncbi:hypothetical protein [Bailinhaonella thermotolerans]|uniref:Uncharacterized protein n=1 Tax=Bailinhaonella thermotolerans TaxID=1070861 RepID=A0A3A4AK60_9ACTN|nr:hypothetical protein [Bailinhaonella thermotolerans]RJL30036.1 hypothetical protein D5H75_24160 [Bailinhaonella thermotolerans]